MKFARYTFLAAGIYGLLVLVPQYFLESQVGADDPPAITHPEYFYGFIGDAAAFQLVFLLIGTNPEKYRAMIIASILEKFSFSLAVAVLLLLGRVQGQILIGAAIDLVLGVLFTICLYSVSQYSRMATGSSNGEKGAARFGRPFESAGEIGGSPAALVGANSDEPPPKISQAACER